MTIIEELLKGCSGQLVDIGGVWKPRVGGPGLPVYFLDDDGIIINQPQDFDPFPPLDQCFNGIQASYPEPDTLALAWVFGRHRIIRHLGRAARISFWRGKPYLLTFRETFTP